MSERQAGAEIEITPEMIEAGVAELTNQFGGETEGDNRMVDFEEAAKKIYSSMTFVPRTPS